MSLVDEGRLRRRGAGELNGIGRSGAAASRILPLGGSDTAMLRRRCRSRDGSPRTRVGGAVCCLGKSHRNTEHKNGITTIPIPSPAVFQQTTTASPDSEE
jgi:hypothetical protein